MLIPQELQLSRLKYRDANLIYNNLRRNARPRAVCPCRVSTLFYYYAVSRICAVYKIGIANIL